MHYKPHELKLVPLRDLPPGTIAKIFDRDTIPFVWRLTDTEEGASRTLVLGGQHAFEIVNWSVDDELAWVVCEASEVQFKLGEPTTNADSRAEGALIVRNGGAYINAQRLQGAGYRIPKIDIATSSDEELDGRMTGFLMFAEWELGVVDRNGEFKPIFKNKPNDPKP